MHAASTAESTSVGLAELHSSFRDKQLEVLIGAGCSIPSGLPDWGTLNRNLLQHFFEQERPTGIPDPEELAVLAEVLESRFGGSAAIDHVREELGRKGKQPEVEFRRLLQKAMYGATTEFETAPVQFELAAWLCAGQHGLYTFNYDDLLERAFERLTGRCPTTLLHPKPLEGLQWICHVHGSLPPGAEPNDDQPLILSEKDYLKDQTGWADRKLKDVFEGGRKVLLVGLSLVDPRLRRQLFERVSQKGTRSSGHVFALMSRSPSLDELDLAHRKAEKIVDERTARYWSEWGVQWLDAGSHIRVPHLLRRIRLGDDVKLWFQTSRDVAGLQGGFDQCDPARRTVITQALETTVNWLRHKFCVREEERMRLTLWMPAPDGDLSIQLAFDSSWPGAGDGRSAPRGACPNDSAPWRLKVIDTNHAQGVAGQAFLENVEIDADSRSSLMDQNFEPAMRSRWKQVRDFASLLCVPVAAGEAWIPIGVACLCSNSRTPFWRDLERTERVDLSLILRGTFEKALEHLRTR